MPRTEQDDERHELALEKAAELGLNVVEDELNLLEVDELERLVANVELAVEKARAAAAAAPAPLVTAIALAMAEAGEVTKSSTNVDQGYKFASAEAILGAVRLPLLTRGVLLTAHPRTYEEREITARSGSKGTLIVVGLDFTFRNGAGEELVIGDWRGIGQDYGDKAIGKAYTNAAKTFVRTNWLLPTEHDDPEASPSGERVAAADTPAWAKDATRARLKKLGENLEPLIGVDAARELVQAVKGNLGVFPDVLVTFSGAIRSRMPADADLTDAERLIRETEAAEAAADLAAQAAAEAPDEEPPPDAGIPIDDDDPPPPEGPPAGSVIVEEIPENPAKAVGVLKAAGCICDDPLGDTHADACPISGHGIPF